MQGRECLVIVEFVGLATKILSFLLVTISIRALCSRMFFKYCKGGDEVSALKRYKRQLCLCPRRAPAWQCHNRGHNWYAGDQHAADLAEMAVGPASARLSRPKPFAFGARQGALGICAFSRNP